MNVRVFSETREVSREGRDVVRPGVGGFGAGASQVGCDLCWDLRGEQRAQQARESEQIARGSGRMERGSELGGAQVGSDELARFTGRAESVGERGDAKAEQHFELRAFADQLGGQQAVSDALVM